MGFSYKSVRRMVDVFLFSSVGGLIAYSCFHPSVGGVIAYASSSSSASSPASCHSEGSENSFQYCSSPSPSSSSSEGSCNSRNKEGSDGTPQCDQLDDHTKSCQSSVALLTKGHSRLTSKYALITVSPSLELSSDTSYLSFPTMQVASSLFSCVNSLSPMVCNYGWR